MIVHINGILDVKTPGCIVVEAAGVGYQMAIPLSTYDKLPATGEKLKILTYHAVREDDELLFGFATAGELDMFKHLLAVNGVGPRLALAVLSGMGVCDLQSAIANGETKRISAIKGIGKKTAERICVELKDRVSLFDAIANGGAGATGGTSEMVRDALLALVALGFAEDAARKQIDAVLASSPAIADTQTLIRRALSGR